MVNYYNWAKYWETAKLILKAEDCNTLAQYILFFERYKALRKLSKDSFRLPSEFICWWISCNEGIHIWWDEGQIVCWVGWKSNCLLGGKKTSWSSNCECLQCTKVIKENTILLIGFFLKNAIIYKDKAVTKPHEIFAKETVTVYLISSSLFISQSEDVTKR